MASGPNLAAPRPTFAYAVNSIPHAILSRDSLRQSGSLRVEDKASATRKYAGCDGMALDGLSRPSNYQDKAIKPIA